MKRFLTIFCSTCIFAVAGLTPLAIVTDSPRIVLLILSVWCLVNVGIFLWAALPGEEKPEKRSIERKDFGLRCGLCYGVMTYERFGNVCTWFCPDCEHREESEGIS